MIYEGMYMTSVHPYDPARFPDGSKVRIASQTVLNKFLQTWKWHHKLEPNQLEYAGQVATVDKSYMYHGGDIIYKLENVPGLWHEQCLEFDTE